jgi:hypothetical protein
MSINPLAGNNPKPVINNLGPVIQEEDLQDIFDRHKLEPSKVPIAYPFGGGLDGKLPQLGITFERKTIKKGNSPYDEVTIKNNVGAKKSIIIKQGETQVTRPLKEKTTLCFPVDCPVFLVDTFSEKAAEVFHIKPFTTERSKDLPKVQFTEGLKHLVAITKTNPDEALILIRDSDLKN